MAERTARDDEAGFIRRDNAFHDVLLPATGNRRLASVVGSVRDAGRSRSASSIGRGRGRDLQAIIAEHEVILEAIRRARALREAIDNSLSMRPLPWSRCRDR